VTAYAISDVEVLDPALAREYGALAGASIAAYGGRYLTRAGGEVDVAEGDWRPANVVLVEFPTLADARRWYASAEYAEALRLRGAALRRNLIFVDGCHR
jgi:uncharacterized protein (DUF1330 family)